MQLPPRLQAVQEQTEKWLARADPVGQPERDLVAAAADHGVEIRVITRDGQHFPLRADRRPSRVNVEIADGRITRVDGVY
jgi:hypothetical protein